jgi:hypothetical protein
MCHPSATNCGTMGPFVCANLQMNKQDCGTCGHACAQDQMCVLGTCK